MAVDHAWEKFSSSIRLALVSEASLQERLDSLMAEVGRLQRDSFPDEHVWDEFRKLVNETTKRTTGYQAGLATSQMSDKKARECLQRAFEIFSDVAKAFGRTEFVI